MQFVIIMVNNQAEFEPVKCCQCLSMRFGIYLIFTSMIFSIILVFDEMFFGIELIKIAENTDHSLGKEKELEMWEKEWDFPDEEAEWWYELEEETDGRILELGFALTLATTAQFIMTLALLYCFMNYIFKSDTLKAR